MLITPPSLPILLSFLWQLDHERGALIHFCIFFHRERLNGYLRRSTPPVITAFQTVLVILSSRTAHKALPLPYPGLA